MAQGGVGREVKDPLTSRLLWGSCLGFQRAEVPGTHVSLAVLLRDVYHPHPSCIVKCSASRSTFSRKGGKPSAAIETAAVGSMRHSEGLQLGRGESRRNSLGAKGEESGLDRDAQSRCSIKVLSIKMLEMLDQRRTWSYLLTDK